MDSWDSSVGSEQLLNCWIQQLRYWSAERAIPAGIGFSQADVDMARLPGWAANSYGYHGDDGKVGVLLASGKKPATTISVI